MSGRTGLRRSASGSLIRRAHPGPVLVARPGDRLLLPAVRTAEQARAQPVPVDALPGVGRPPAGD